MNRLHLARLVRNLTGADDGGLHGNSYLIMDRNAKFTLELRSMLEREGLKPVLFSVGRTTAMRSPSDLLV